MNKIHFKINNQEVFGYSGQSVLEIARENEIHIPTLCYHPRLSVVGSCRLCAVEIKGWQGVHMACAIQPSEGMEVVTESETISKVRKSVLELLLLKYYDDHPDHIEQRETEFEYYLKAYNVKRPDWSTPEKWTERDSDPHPFVRVDMNKCILCTRCVRVCTEIQGSFIWGVSHRGADSRIVAGVDMPMLEAGCESCGLCVQVCPSGALDDRLSINKGLPDKVVETICPYCGVGCQLSLHIKSNKIIRVNVRDEGPTNGIALCVKGRYGYHFVQHPDRVKTPLVRRYLLDERLRDEGEERGEWVEVDWDTALGITAERFAKIKEESGPDAIGVLASAKCTNEENYLFQKFARQVIGTHNVDHCARL